MSPNPRRREQQVHQWLRNMVDAGNCPGVEWVDKNKAIFKILWCNMKSQEWREEHSRIFLEYAKYTGKYRSDQPKNYSKYKQNLKSAIYKNKFIERLTNTGSKSHRFYKFVQEKTPPLSSPDQEDQELITGPSTQEDINIMMPEAGNDPLQTFALNDVYSTLNFNGTVSDSLTSLDFFMQENDAAMFDIIIDGPCHDNSLSQQETISLNNIRNRLPKSKTSEEHDQNQTARNYNLPPSGQYEEMDCSNIPCFLQSMITDTTTDTITVDNVNPYYVKDTDNQFRRHDCGIPITKVTKIATGKPPYTQTSMLETLVKEQGTKKKDQTHDMPRKIETISSGKVNNTTIIQKNQLPPPSSSNITDVRGLVSQDSSYSMDIFDGRSSFHKNESFQSHSMTHSTPSEAIVSCYSQVSDLMQIQVIYGTPSRVVKRELIKATKCKIFCGKVNNKRLQKEIDDKDKNAVQIELPSAENLDFSEESKKKIRNVLAEMELGVIITYRNDDIYVVRRCKPHVYLSDGISTSQKLPRSKVRGTDEEIKAFDFNGSFKKSMTNHKEKGEPIDKNYFLLTFGYTVVPNDPSPTRHLPVFIVIDHVSAARLRTEELGADATDPMYSLSDSFDRKISFSNTF